jgi:hypothetical protein
MDRTGIRCKTLGRTILASAALAAIGLAAPVFAADKLWVTDGGDYNVAGNWNATGVPGAADDAVVSDNKTALITNNLPDGHQLYVSSTGDHGGATTGGGTLNHSAGSLHLAGTQSWMVVGDKNGFTGTYNMSGGASLLIDDDFMTIGQNGTGFLNMSGNSSINTRGLIFGRWNAPGNGTGTIGGNATINTREGGFTVAQQGIGNVTQNGGGVTVMASGDGNAWMYVGRDGGSNGTYNMAGGTLNSGTRIQVGQNLGSNGKFVQTGGVVTVGSNMSVGDAGTGTLDASGGTLNVNGEGLIIGAWRDGGAPANPGGQGTLKVSGNAILNLANLRLGRGDVANNVYPTGTTLQSGGTINVVDTLSVGSGHALSVGTYTMTGGLLKLGTGGLQIANDGSTGTFNLQGGTLDGQGRNITKGSGNATFTMTGGVLKNVNSIGFDVSQAGGTIAPGDSMGKTTINGAYTEQLAASLAIDLSGAAPVAEYDQLAVTGQVTVVGDLAVALGVGFTPTLGQQFTILDNQGPTDILGFFTGKPQDSTFVVGTSAFQISYHGGIGNNDVVLTTVPAPEPATVALVGLGVAGALGMRPRRRVRGA